MNTITFSNYEASTTGKSTLSSGNGYNVEIKEEGKEWSMWAVAENNYPSGINWKLTHIRIVGKENVYPNTCDIGCFMVSVDAYIDAILNKLIPNP